MQEVKKTDTKALSVLTTLFFMWGFITVMNDILIPYLKGVFKLNYMEAMLVQFAFFGAYFIGSLVYFFISVKFGDPINKIGYKNGIIIGLILSAIGTAMFYPASQFSSYSFFLTALFILGLGLTMLQITSNPYVAIIGPSETASGRLNLSQAFNSLGTTLAPIVGSILLFQVFAVSATNSGAVKVPYLIFSGLFLLLAVMIYFAKLPVFTNNQVSIKGIGALKFPYLVLGILAIFMYVGAEVSIGSFMISFLGLPEIAGLKATEAGHYVAFYWGGLMIGRFTGAISLSEMKNPMKSIIMVIIPLIAFFVIWNLKGIDTASIYAIFLILNILGFRLGKFSASRTLFVFALVAVSLLITSMFTNGFVSMWCLIGIGLFNSIMWSNIFTLAIDGLGDYTSQGSSLLVMAILGGALLPVLQGKMADIFGVHNSFWVPVTSYLYLAFYGIKGCKIGRKKEL
jgi:MFS transporter, FHS family, L-fucose permease